MCGQKKYNSHQEILVWKTFNNKAKIGHKLREIQTIFDKDEEIKS